MIETKDNIIYLHTKNTSYVIGIFQNDVLLHLYWGKRISNCISKFPNVLFESCSSGGGRFDAGMLYFIPQT